jgi:SAM-dependent methyltransferase
VFDGGTFSSLDFEKGLAEITRVLKPNGVLVGIETFGHNPFANAKRVLNRITGKRTAWAASHIVTKREIERLQQNFEQVEVYYFHFISLFAFPFLGLPGGKFVLQLGQFLDKLVFAIPFFRTYAFKVVFVCSKPIKELTS